MCPSENSAYVLLWVRFRPKLDRASEAGRALGTEVHRLPIELDEDLGRPAAPAGHLNPFQGSSLSLLAAVE